MTPKQRRIWRNVRDRDADTCQDCGGRGSEVHHIVSRIWEEKNMLVLCRECHQCKDKGAGAHTHAARKRHLRYLREKYGYEYTERKYLEALEEAGSC